MSLWYEILSIRNKVIHIFKASCISNIFEQKRVASSEQHLARCMDFGFFLEKKNFFLVKH